MVHIIKGRKIEVYDNPKTLDRYTVAVGNYIFGMSEHPASPFGVNQFAGMKKDLRFWRQGKKIQFNKLPKEVQEAIRKRI